MLNSYPNFLIQLYNYPNCLLWFSPMVLIKVYNIHFNTNECETDYDRGFWRLLSFAFRCVISLFKYCSFCL